MICRNLNEIVQCCKINVKHIICCDRERQISLETSPVKIDAATKCVWQIWNKLKSNELFVI